MADNSVSAKYGIEDLLRSLIANKGSDLHLSAGSPPRIRVNGQLLPLNLPPLTPPESQGLVYSILSGDQAATLKRERELNTALGVSGLGRFRVNVFYQRGALAAALRTIPYNIPNFADLGLPSRVFERLCALRRGLVLVAGATGGGKSTTLAAMVDHINAHSDCHIITIENPLEFLHKNRRSLVTQREIGPDSSSYHSALRHAMRQDPDVVMIGDMPDAGTVRLAFDLAESGRLVLAASPTADAVQTIGRLIDFGPQAEKEQFRTRLAAVLEAIVAQRLVPLADGTGRIPALEVLVANNPIRAAIRAGKIHQIYAAIQAGAREGMATMNASLLERIAAGRISRDAAMDFTARPDELLELLGLRGGGDA